QRRCAEQQHDLRSDVNSPQRLVRVNIGDGRQPVANEHLAPQADGDDEQIHRAADAREPLHCWNAYDTLKNSDRSNRARILSGVSTRSSPYPTYNTVCQLIL